MTGISYHLNSRVSCKKDFKKLRFSRGWQSLERAHMAGFWIKLHLVINEIGEIQSLTLSKGNADDRKPVDRKTDRTFVWR